MTEKASNLEVQAIRHRFPNKVPVSIKHIELNLAKYICSRDSLLTMKFRFDHDYFKNG